MTQRSARETTPGCPGLIPHGIVALGTPTPPVERLIGVQSAVYRLIVWLGSPRASRRPLRPHRVPLAAEPRLL